MRSTLLLLLAGLFAVACGARETPEDTPAAFAPAGGTPAATVGGPHPMAVMDPAAPAREQPSPATPSHVLVPPATAAPPGPLGLPVPEVEAAAVLVLDEASGAVLYERDAHRRLPPASLTKIATALVAIRQGDIDRVVTTEPDIERYWELDLMTMGLEPGDQFSVRDLLYGLLLPSGADAAEILATETAGSIDAFVARMNGLVAALGLKDTHFIDPHGLGGPAHYSSAYDLALLARYAMSVDTFRQVAGTETYTAHGSRDLSLYNDNPLLNYTPGVDGVKTGYTEDAGPTFVASATRDGHRVYVVLLNAPNMAFDTIDLVEWAFAAHTWP